MTSMDAGVVRATLVDLGGGENIPPPQGNPADVMSPETNEFVTLERQIMDLDSPSPPPPPPPPPISSTEEEDYFPTSPPPPPMPSQQVGVAVRKRSDEVYSQMEAEEAHRLQLQSELEEKLEERKRSMDMSQENGMQLMERRQLRQFSR